MQMEGIKKRQSIQRAKDAKVNLLRKRLCQECKYRTTAGSLLSDTDYDKYVDRDPKTPMFACGYAYITDNCCTRKDGSDIRGDDPSKCKIFSPGPAKERKMRPALVEIKQSERYDIDPYWSEKRR